MKPHSFLGILVAVTLLFNGVGVGSSSAQEMPQPTAQQINCDKPMSTFEINECSRREAEAADKKLNQVYQQLKPQLGVQQRERLTNAQVAWISFRDKTCEYERGEWGNASVNTGLRYLVTQTK
jgi:uncharacterized protein YecT (DUF1311 family)